MAVHEQTKNKLDLTYPGRFNVILLNDDKTPMEFVIELLIVVFNKSIEQAMVITTTVHEKGRDIAGSYSSEVAEQKQLEATTMTRQCGWPLKTIIEKM